MKNGEDSASASGTASGGSVRNKMKFAPGWSARGASAVGLVRSSSLSSGRTQAASSGNNSNNNSSTSGNSAFGGSHLPSSSGDGFGSLVPAGVPTPNDSYAMPASAKPYASLGKPIAAPRPKEETAATKLARIGRVPTPSTAGSGKLTEQANLYQQRSKSPRDPSLLPNTSNSANSAFGGGFGNATNASNGAPRLKYSREELYLFNPMSAPRPAFPVHVPGGLLSDVPLMLAHGEKLDRESLLAKWQEDSEKRNSARNAVGLGHERRGGAGGAGGASATTAAGTPGQVGRGRRLPEGLGAAQEAGASGGRRGFNSYGNGGGSWRGPSGTPSGPARDGGRFGSLAGNGTPGAGGRTPAERSHGWTGQDRSAGTAPGATSAAVQASASTTASSSRWNDLPQAGGSSATSDRDGPPRRTGEGGSRWDRLGPSSGRSFPDRTYPGAAGGAVAGNPAATAGTPSREDRWGRNAAYREGGSAFGARGGAGGLGGTGFGPGDQLEEPFDDRGTFSEEAMSGSFGLESMAAAASKFHEEMVASRGGNEGSGKDEAESASAAATTDPNAGGSNSGGGFFADTADPGMSGALEDGVDHPPAEETASSSQAMDAPSLGFGGPGGLGAQSHLLQPQQPSWNQNPWLDTSAHHEMTGLAIHQMPMQQPQQHQQPDLSNRWIVPPAGPQGLHMPPPPQQQHQQLPGGLGIPPMLPPMPQLSNEWYYRDPQGNVQGPFKSEEMREWLEHGYFNPDLLVRRGHNNEAFVPLGQQFPDPLKAFTAEGDAEIQMRRIQQQQQQQPGGFWQMGQGLPMQQPMHLGMQHHHQQPYGQPQQQQQPQQQPESSSEDAQLKQQQELAQRQAAEERARAEKEKVEWEARERERVEREQKEEEERKRKQEEEEQARREAAEAEETARREAEAEELKRKQEEEERERQAQAQAEMEAQERIRQAEAAAQEEQRRLQAAALEEEQRRRKEAEEEEARLEEERREAERRKAEEKPAWGGVAVAAPASTLSLKEIQELEQREATRMHPEGSSQSMAARIAQAAGVAGGRLSGNLPTPATAAAAAAVSSIPSPQNQPQQSRTTSVSTPPAAPASQPVESSKPISASGGTLDEMSIDLRAMLGVSAPGGKKKKATPAKPAWGGSASSAPNSSNRSLKEIQEEEARRIALKQQQMQQQMQAQQQQQQAQQQQQQQQQQSRAPPGSWASTAAQPNNGDGWNIAHKGRTNVSSSTPQAARSATKAKPVQAMSQARKPIMQSTPSPDEQQADEDASVNFGKEMSRDMRKWCEGQVSKIGATMTLIEFCYSLEDASDIREYLRDYLGSTPQVSAFASEFIARKAGKVGGDDFGPDAGFQTAGKKKKNRKAK